MINICYSRVVYGGFCFFDLVFFDISVFDGVVIFLNYKSYVVFVVMIIVVNVLIYCFSGVIGVEFFCVYVVY